MTSASMNEQSIATFQGAILATHGCESEHIATVYVLETFNGRTIFDGDVLVFDLIGHPTALTCYAWSMDDQQVRAVLREEPVDSPEAAVRAALVQEHCERD